MHSPKSLGREFADAARQASFRARPTCRCFFDGEQNCEAELPDASRDFRDLLLGIGVCIRGMRRGIPTAAWLIWLRDHMAPENKSPSYTPYRTTIGNVLES